MTIAMRLIEEATDGLSEPELTRSSDAHWTPAQVLEHLAKAFGGSAKAMEQHVASGELPPLRSRSLKDRIGVFLICDLGYFPEGRSAPTQTVPTENPEGLVAVRRIKENLVRAGRAIDECEKRWGARVCIMNHPVLGPLTVPQWRAFHLAHTRHHMKQVRERAARNRQALSSTATG